VFLAELRFRGDSEGTVELVRVELPRRSCVALISRAEGMIRRSPAVSCSGHFTLVRLAHQSALSYREEP
jgi:hypothetical protein